MTAQARLWPGLTREGRLACRVCCCKSWFPFLLRSVPWPCWVDDDGEAKSVPFGLTSEGRQRGGCEGEGRGVLEAGQECLTHREECAISLFCSVDPFARAGDGGAKRRIADGVWKLGGLRNFGQDHDSLPSEREREYSGSILLGAAVSIEDETGGSTTGEAEETAGEIRWRKEEGKGAPVESSTRSERPVIGNRVTRRMHLCSRADTFRGKVFRTQRTRREQVSCSFPLQETFLCPNFSIRRKMKQKPRVVFARKIVRYQLNLRTFREIARTRPLPFLDEVVAPAAPDNSTFH